MEQDKEHQGKLLMILRHAVAMPSSTAGDKERPLAPKGVDDALALGRYMKQKQFIPAIVLCSPALRTRQTLGGLTASLGSITAEFPDRFYSGTAEDYLREINDAEDAFECLLLLGHNPAIHELAARMAGSGEESQMQRLAESYKPATLTVLHAPVSSWQGLRLGQCRIMDIADPLDYNAPARPTRWM